MLSRTSELRKIYRLTGSGSSTRAETLYDCICPSDRELKTPSQLQYSLRKASSGQYDGVLFAHGTIESKQGDSLIKEIRRLGMTPVASLPLDLARNQLSRFMWFEERAKVSGCHLYYLVTDTLDLNPEVLPALTRPNPDSSILAVVTRALNLHALIEWLPRETWSKVRLYFPHHQSECPDLLTTADVFSLLEQVQARWPDFPVRGPGGLEIYDPRIPQDLELEPVLEPVFTSNLASTPEVSFVIPSFDNGRHLLQTLSHLERQNVALGAFEVIVVDDGSQDETLEKMIPLRHSTRLPLTFLHIQRETPRSMGDNRFRAGAARNLGVKFARAPILQFLDCDILVGPNHVATLIRDHAHADVIQAKRLQLTPEATLSGPHHETLVEGSDTYVPEGAYWETFQDTTVDWNELPAKWKYISSFCLSVKTEHFKRAGWFKKVHAWYGFEDTDLGMRLLADQRRLHLSASRVYHLYHRDERSEWGNSMDRKRALLSRTCKIFYHHHLDPRIFNELRVFLA